MKNVFKYAYSLTLCVLVLSCSKKEQPIEEISQGFDLKIATFSNLKLSVYKGLNQTELKSDLTVDVVYNTPNSGGAGFQLIPNGFDNNIESFNIPQGYMVTFAENADGTGESICYVAATNIMNQNLPTRLRNKISFIRYLPIDIPNKKGVCQTNIQVSTVLGATWFYNWGNSQNSTSNQQYVPMTWGGFAANTTSALALIQKDNISHLSSFNEPDNASQANMPDIDVAVEKYKIMMRTGLRLGSPVTEQDNALAIGDWLPTFMAKAEAAKARVDYINVHWYDWGNQTQTGATDDATATGALNRLKTYLGNIHAKYPNHPVWITEFNCNPNRTSENVHILFMQKATAWLNGVSYIERYAYFFPSSLQPTSGAPDYNITTLGQTWKNQSSPPTFSANVVPN